MYVLDNHEPLWEEDRDTGVSISVSVDRRIVPVCQSNYQREKQAVFSESAYLSHFSRLIALYSTTLMISARSKPDRAHLLKCRGYSWLVLARPE